MSLLSSRSIRFLSSNQRAGPAVELVQLLSLKLQCSFDILRSKHTVIQLAYLDAGGTFSHCRSLTSWPRLDLRIMYDQLTDLEAKAHHELARCNFVIACVPEDRPQPNPSAGKLEDEGTSSALVTPETGCGNRVAFHPPAIVMGTVYQSTFKSSYSACAAEARRPDHTINLVTHHAELQLVGRPFSARCHRCCAVQLSACKQQHLRTG